MSLYRTAAFAVLAGMAAAQTAQAQTSTPAPTLTLADALARALDDDPGVRAAAAARRAADANVAQAGRRANPSLDIFVENVEGSGLNRSSETTETTYSLSQMLELGGDRRARRVLAERESDAARVGDAIRRLDLLQEVELAFIDVQAAEATRAVAEERLSVARELARAVERRVRAARDPLMAGSRAEARLAEAEIEAERARRNAAAARQRLASFWGGADDFRLETESFGRIGARIAEARGSRPDVALAEVERDQADARVRLEQARRIPDPTVLAGVRQFGDTDETGVVFGFSVPLQVWDRNSSAIARARFDRARAGYEVEARRRAVEREAAMLASQAQTARLEAEALDARVIPHAQQALRQAREGYAMGGFSYLDVLEAQRALTDARLQRISAVRSYHRAEAALARLHGARTESGETSR